MSYIALVISCPSSIRKYNNLAIRTSKTENINTIYYNYFTHGSIILWNYISVVCNTIDKITVLVKFLYLLKCRHFPIFSKYSTSCIISSNSRYICDKCSSWRSIIHINIIKTIVKLKPLSFLFILWIMTINITPRKERTFILCKIGCKTVFLSDVNVPSCPQRTTWQSKVYIYVIFKNWITKSI